MEFIIKNYMLIIMVGLFFVFALIGYLIEMLKNNKEENKNENSIQINTTIENINTLRKEIKEDKLENNISTSGDDLLENYNNINKE